MSWSDAAGLAGVLMMLVAYAAAAMGRMDPQRVPALMCNLVGSALVLLSLSRNFNLSAAVMESAWLLVAVAGLVRLALKRRS
jgi:hypothetical protein